MSPEDEAGNSAPPHGPPLLDLDFALDGFQQVAVDHLLDGASVVVAAPTGAGKTLVADHAIELAHRDGKKAFYTTPIKALSNQKFNDLRRRYGNDAVGLLTGDASINGDADIVVMTTEVLRNMIYENARKLRNLAYVVLDEVHYLQDPYRGPVWEEVIVHLPLDVRLVCLSATVSNAAELAEWITSVRSRTELVTHDERPVNLTNLFLSGDREGRQTHLIDTLLNDRPNPEGHRFTDAPKRRRGSPGRTRKRFITPTRAEVLEVLADRNMLPAIVFIFSRAGCDDAANAMASSGVLLTDSRERDAIRELAEHHARHLDLAERQALQFDRFVANLERGVAAHHAGMVPAFKETVESCFVRGLIKMVFATETLALGINMPARAVVIERLTKYNGDTHEFLTPLQYTQLTGRAGRRGIDDRGYAVVLWSPFVTFDQVAQLASSKKFELTSVFRPTYNMAANLVRLHDRDGAHALLDRSFAQFQQSSDEGRLERRKARVSKEVAELEAELRADDVDVDAVGQPVPEPNVELRRAIATAIAGLKPGDVIRVETPDRREPAAVLSVGYRSGGDVKVRLVARSHKRMTLTPSDFTEPPEVVGLIELPTPYQPNNGGFQHEVIRRLQRTRIKKSKNTANANRATNSDEFSLSKDQRKGARQLADKRAQLDRINQRMSSRSGRLARQFDEIVGILQLRGYIADWQLTKSGEMLRGIYHETDLAIAEALRQGLFDELRAAELAGLVSCFTYEHRGSGASAPPRLRSAALRERFARLDEVVADLREDETTAGIRLTRELDPGFVEIAAAWAGGDELGNVLDTEELTGGDFVRQIRQLIDVLRQIAGVAPRPETRQAANAAAEAIHRGVVVATTTTDPDDEDTGAAPTEAEPDAD